MENLNTKISISFLTYFSPFFVIHRAPKSFSFSFQMDSRFIESETLFSENFTIGFKKHQHCFHILLHNLLNLLFCFMRDTSYILRVSLSLLCITYDFWDVKHDFPKTSYLDSIKVKIWNLKIRFHLFKHDFLNSTCVITHGTCFSFFFKHHVRFRRIQNKFSLNFPFGFQKN